MRVREFESWRKYSRQRGLPSERLQLQVALLAMIVTNFMNENPNNDLSDFVIGEERPAEEVKSTVDAAKAFVGGEGGKSVVRLGQKRKPRKKAA